MCLESQDTVTDIIIMRHLYLIKENNIFKLGRISDNSTLSNDGISTDERTVTNLCLLINNGRSIDKGTRCNRGIIGYPCLLYTSDSEDSSEEDEFAYGDVPGTSTEDSAEASDEETVE